MNETSGPLRNERGAYGDGGMRRRGVVLDSLLYRGDAWLKEARDV